MLFVLLYVGEDRYVIDAQKVIEVVPLVKLNNYANTPDYISGLCNYRAVPVPVIDVHHLINGVKSKQVMSTRILLVSYRSHTGCDHVLGVIAEYATETVTLEMSSFHKSSLQASEDNYVSNIMTDKLGIIQWMDVDRLLSQHDCEILYGREADVDADE